MLLLRIDLRSLTNRMDIWDERDHQYLEKNRNGNILILYHTQDDQYGRRDDTKR